jgi:cyclase
MILKMSLALAAGIGAAFLSMSASAQFGGEPSKLDLVKVQDDVYVIHNELVPGNTTAVITDDGVLMVDNKFPVDYPNIMRLLRTVTDQPVKYVVNTHYHGDHSGSNALMQADGTQVIASENARIKMIDGNQSGLPDLTLDDHMRVYLGGIEFDIHYFGRSHTDGDIVVHIPDHSLIIMGDMFTHGEGVPELIDYAGGGSARAWTSTLDGALQLDFDTVIPGHGAAQTSRAVLEDYRDSTARLQETVRQMRRANRSPADIEAVLRSEFGWEDFHVGMSLPGLLVELQ